MSISRRNFLRGASIAAGVATVSAPSLLFANEQKKLETIEAIMTRRSIRSFTDQQVSAEQIDIILRAAMAAPSAYNEQPWEFIVVNDKEKILALSKINKYGSFMKSAPMGILTCVDNDKVKHQKGYGIIDVSIATQNILLAAHALGLGAIWTGVYPNERIQPLVVKEFGLPENIIPLAFVPIGYPKAIPKQKNHYKAERIRYNTW